VSRRGCPTRPLRRGLVVGECLVGVERAVAIAALQLCRGGQFERAGAPGIAVFGQPLQTLDGDLRIAVRQAVHGRQQNRQIAKLAVDTRRAGEIVISGDRPLAVAAFGQQLGLLE
jgi:hypothetical protein